MKKKIDLIILTKIRELNNLSNYNLQSHRLLEAYSPSFGQKKANIEFEQRP